MGGRGAFGHLFLYKMKSSYKPHSPWNKGKINCYSSEQIEKLRENGKIYGKIGGRGNKKLLE